MYITNGQVFLPEGRFEKADILCGDRITAISGGDTQVTVQELTDGEMIDATGKYIIPGLVDIHTHGAVNADASDGDADGLRRMSRYYAQRGVTSWCPTTMTLSEKSLLHAMHAIRDFESDGAHCVGVHLEGPFLSYEKRGAQNAQYLQKQNMEELEKQVQKIKSQAGNYKTAINDYIEEQKKELFEYVNSRVNNFSKLQLVLVQHEPFEKTPTHKIKRFLYNNINIK